MLTYCTSIGAEYMHINETAQKRWLQNRLEANQAQLQLSKVEKHQILERLAGYCAAINEDDTA